MDLSDATRVTSSQASSTLSAPNSASYSVRVATVDDIPRLQSILEHYVLNTQISFRKIVPDLRAKFDTRIFDWYVAETRDEKREVIGTCYVSAFREGWERTVEDTIYIAPEHTGKGVGELMMRVLLRALAASDKGFRNVIASISAGNGDLGKASVALHKKLGFVECGHMHHVGFKFGVWLDAVFMELDLNELHK